MFGGPKDFARLVACGSVDDGKSTLIGRLIYEAGHIPDDERAALERASLIHGTRGGEIDFALLLDGLEAEREQGITIDVAWRHLETARRRFLIADCPGHVQYTRNMATGSSVADIAIVVVDVTKGLLRQTLQHTAILALLAVRHVVLAVNKMDRVGFDRTAYDVIEAQYRAHAARLGLEQITAVPISAALGINVITDASEAIIWYDGPHLLKVLETLDVEPPEGGVPRISVQHVVRDYAGSRWLAGSTTGNGVCVGDRLRIEPSGVEATVAALLRGGVQASASRAGDAVTLRFSEDVDAGRGDVLTPVDAPLPVSDQFSADILWFSETPLVSGRRFRVKMATRTLGARIVELKHRLDPESLQPLAARQLDFNDLGMITFALDSPVPYAPYREDRFFGAFVVIDPVGNATVGAGMIRHGLRRAQNIHWQTLDVDRHARACLNGHQPRCVWFTGLSGAGKSTIANLVERALSSRGIHTYLLDGDNLRLGLNRDLGFTDRDRIESQRRVAEVAKLMSDAGLVVLVSLISPFCSEREATRARFAQGEFVEVFVDTPLEVAEQRDVKGLYRKARAGDLPNFTGIDSAYEAPQAAELVLDTVTSSAEMLAEQVVDYLLAD